MTHRDIAALHIMGMVHTSILAVQESFGILDILTAYPESMEMLSYMPALWMLFQTDEKLLVFEPLSQVVSQRQAVWSLA